MKKKIIATAIISLLSFNVYSQTVSVSEKEAIIKESVDEIAAMSHSDNVKNVTAEYGGNQVIAALNKASATTVTSISNKPNAQLRLPPSFTRKINSIMNADVGSIAKGAYQNIMSKNITGVGLATVALESTTHTGRKLLVKEAVIGTAGIVSFQYLVDNSDKIEDYFSKYPDKVQDFYNYLEKKKSEATDSGMYDYYVGLEKKLGLDSGFIDEVAQVEATSQYQAILNNLEQQATAIDSAWAQTHPNQQQCSISDLEDIVSLNNKEYLAKHPLVEALTFPTPYKVGSMPIYSVASFKQLKDNYKNNPGNIVQNQDHIPSYAAIRDYLKHKGLNVTVYKREKDSEENRIINDSNDVRHAKLNNNLTAFSVEEILHEKGRTYSGRNSSTQIFDDKKNLKLATLKDMAFTAYYIENHPTLYKISANDYIKISWTIYYRNKEMCLYDIPY